MSRLALTLAAFVVAATAAHAADTQPLPEWQTLWWDQHEGSETQLNMPSVKVRGQHVNVWMRVQYDTPQHVESGATYDMYVFRADFDCDNDMMTIQAARFISGQQVVNSFDTPLQPTNIEPDTVASLWEPVICAPVRHGK